MPNHHRKERHAMLKKKIMAYWGAVCPGCTIARTYPDSFIGKKVIAHWKQGCPVHEAYLEFFGKIDKDTKRGDSKKQ